MKFDNLLLNGFPKAGNHALRKACELLGVPKQVNHIPFTAQSEPLSQLFPAGYNPEMLKWIVIKRDPRNALISWLRFQQKEVTVGTFLAAFRLFQTKSFVDEMGDYEGWLTAPDTLIVSYEDLTKDDKEMRRIADFLGTPYFDGAFEKLEGLTITYNKVHSDYKTLWTPQLEQIWDEEGGNALLTRWGYGNTTVA